MSFRELVAGLIFGCARHPINLASPIPGLLVELYPKAGHQLVEATEEINDCHQLQHPFVIQS